MRDLTKTINTIKLIKENFGNKEFVYADYEEHAKYLGNAVYHSLSNCGHLLEDVGYEKITFSKPVSYINNIQVTPSQIRFLKDLGIEFKAERKTKEVNTGFVRSKYKLRVSDRFLYEVEKELESCKKLLELVEEDL